MTPSAGWITYSGDPTTLTFVSQTDSINSKTFTIQAKQPDCNDQLTSPGKITIDVGCFYETVINNNHMASTYIIPPSLTPGDTMFIPMYGLGPFLDEYQFVTDYQTTCPVTNYLTVDSALNAFIDSDCYLTSSSTTDKEFNILIDHSYTKTCSLKISTYSDVQIVDFSITVCGKETVVPSNSSELLNFTYALDPGVFAEMPILN